MKILELVPPPKQCETFKRSRARFVPEGSGCYALTTFSKEVLYIGLSTNLRRRMNEHLNSPDKIGETRVGRAVLFFWLESDNISKVERAWQNMHVQHEGHLPELNRLNSPVST
jgi:predicted GIY-YIG superfamily endonuclease